MSDAAPPTRPGGDLPPAMAALVRRSRRIAAAGALAGAPAAAALAVAGAGWLHGALLSGVFVVLPALGLAQAVVLPLVRIERLPVYAGSAVALAALGAVYGTAGGLTLGAGALRLAPAPRAAAAAWVVGAVAAALVLAVGFREVERASGRPSPAVLRDLLPRTPRERRAFAGLSLTAGLCEEVVFRGYALAVLGAWVGMPAAVVLTSAAFGLLHPYQGAVGVVRAASLGAVMAGAVLVSGSLWTAVAAHTLYDLLAGIVLGERLVVHPQDLGV